MRYSIIRKRKTVRGRLHRDMSAKHTHSRMPRPPLLTNCLNPANPLARVLDLAADAIVSVDMQQSIVFFNQGAERAFGYAAAEVSGKPLRLLLPGGLANLSPVAMRRAGEHGESVGRRKDGREFTVHVSLAEVEFAGLKLLNLVLQDVTQRASTEERLRAALQEKEVLLEEVHHRVKNNLQVITSLLGLQARSIKDPGTRVKFEESRYRIQAMAILHEILDESSSLAEIDFADYLRRLVKHLIKSYGAAGRIRTQVHLDPVFCHRDIALPCGLIVTELLSNAFKYAFPGGRPGEIRLKLQRDTEGMIRLLVADNGIGLPHGWRWETSQSLGLRLVRTLARQIEADIQIGKGSGAVFSMVFRDGLPVCAK